MVQEGKMRMEQIRDDWRVKGMLYAVKKIQ